MSDGKRMSISLSRSRVVRCLLAEQLLFPGLCSHRVSNRLQRASAKSPRLHSFFFFLLACDAHKHSPPTTFIPLQNFVHSFTNSCTSSTFTRFFPVVCT